MVTNHAPATTAFRPRCKLEILLKAITVLETSCFP